MNETFGFDKAINCLKSGLKVARNGWNGKGQFVFMKQGHTVDVDDLYDGAFLDAAEYAGLDEINLRPYLALKAVGNNIIIGWLASQTDMLAEDWYVVQ